MHSRRYFTKALDAGDQRAALPLAAYKKIYKIEEEIREHDPPLTHTQVLAVRVEKIKPVFDELVAWSRAHQPAMLPLVGVDPLEHLVDVLPILTRDIRLADMPALFPVRWKARRDAATSAQ